MVALPPRAIDVLRGDPPLVLERSRDLVARRGALPCSSCASSGFLAMAQWGAVRRQDRERVELSAVDRPWRDVVLALATVG